MGDMHVLMLVGNNIRHDTRVLKSALAVADGGARVTVIGYGDEGYPEHTSFGDVEIHRVPVAWRLRDKARDRRDRFTAGSLVPDMTGSERRMVVRRARLRSAEAAELGGRERELRAKATKVGASMRTRLGRLQERLSHTEQEWRASALDWYDGQTRLASWRRDLPAIDDYEFAYSGLVDRLDWDVIHAHDVHHMGTAARAVARRRAQGRDAWWIYDAHEFVPGLSLYPPRTARVRAAYVDLEREFIPFADAVVTVTDALAAELQQRHSLPRRPGVVVNSPVLDGDLEIGRHHIRAVCGLSPDTPLLVYAGGVTAARGIQTAVSALPDLPGVHLAVVCVPSAEVSPARDLADLATRLGVADRLHLLDPVAPDDVSAYVSSADIGIIPLVHFGSHEFALANKLFEYLHAGLPLLVSDCRAQAEFVRGHDVGEVHRAEDVADFVRAARRVLERAPELRRHITENPQMLAPYDWHRQAAGLREVYRGLVGGDRLIEPQTPTDLSQVTEEPLWRDERPSVLGIGATNAAGQGWAWAKAVERHVPGVDTYVVAVDRGGPLTFDADEVVPWSVFRTNQRFSADLQQRINVGWTHALIETGRSLIGTRYGRDFVTDAEALRAVGIRVGLIFHGSEIRDPELNTRRTPYSPYTDPLDPLTTSLQTQRNELMPKVEVFIEGEVGPVFVSTPDLLLDVPGSIWLPVVGDPGVWHAEPTAFDREVPVVLHVPSRARIKGTEAADRVGLLLESEGLIEYRRLENVVPQEMPSHVKDCDIVLDQFALGAYGAAAVEAMFAGRIVLSHVVDAVREQVPGCPIVEANPDTLENVIRALVADRDRGREAARAGQAYAHEWHDGRRSAQILTEHLRLHG